MTQKKGRIKRELLSFFQTDDKKTYRKKRRWSNKTRDDRYGLLLISLRGYDHHLASPAGTEYFSISLTFSLIDLFTCGIKAYLKISMSYVPYSSKMSYQSLPNFTDCLHMLFI